MSPSWFNLGFERGICPPKKRLSHVLPQKNALELKVPVFLYDLFKCLTLLL